MSRSEPLSPEWWDNPPEGSMLAAMPIEARRKLRAAMEEGEALCREWEFKLARGLTDAKVDQVMGAKR